MIDLHTHSLLSDGDLIPSELARRAEVAGLTAIAITDHVDHSNLELTIKSVINCARELNRYWRIKIIPGVEITHVPLESFRELTRRARRLGAKIVVAHGESPVEPVIKGTNKAAILAGVDILAHPGHITKEDTCLAKKKGVYLEITTRRGHSKTNGHVFKMAQKYGAKLVLDTDSHTPENIITVPERLKFLKTLVKSDKAMREIVRNSEDIVGNLFS